MSQTLQPAATPSFTSIRISSTNELPLIIKTELKKLNSPLVLINIDDFEISDLKNKITDIKRLCADKVGLSLSREKLVYNAHESLEDNLSEAQLSEIELFKFLDWTQDEAVERMQLSLPIALNSLKDSVRQHAKIGKTLVLTHNLEKIATCIGYDMIIDDEPNTLISWVWIKSNISTTIRAAVVSRINFWLSCTAQSKIFASVHIENDRSIRFFSKLGFKPSCLFVRP
jgi:predicted DNA-binding protein (UPF0251 family)